MPESCGDVAFDPKRTLSPLIPEPVNRPSVLDVTGRAHPGSALGQNRKSRVQVASNKKPPAGSRDEV